MIKFEIQKDNLGHIIESGLKRRQENKDLFHLKENKEHINQRKALDKERRKAM